MTFSIAHWRCSLGLSVVARSFGTFFTRLMRYIDRGLILRRATVSPSSSLWSTLPFSLEDIPPSSSRTSSTRTRRRSPSSTSRRQELTRRGYHCTRRTKVFSSELRRGGVRAETPRAEPALYSAVNENDDGALQSFTIGPQGALTGPIGQISTGGGSPAFESGISASRVAVMNVRDPRTLRTARFSPSLFMSAVQHGQRQDRAHLGRRPPVL